MIEQDVPIGDSLTSRAAAVLKAAEPARKVSLSRQAAAAWRTGEIEVGAAVPPDHPARPDRPELLAPRHMPKRNAGGERTARAAPA